MKKIYLPELKYVKVTNFNLYPKKDELYFDFLSGINAIIGINGIGKTTLVEILLYCLVGFDRVIEDRLRTGQKKKGVMYRNINYFYDRIDKELVNKNSITAEIKYFLGKNEVIVTRNLAKNEIMNFKINNIEFDNDLELYERKITELANLSSFDGYYTLVKNFLYFDENRDNIAWDLEQQEELLRIIFFDNDNNAEFIELEQMMFKADSDGRKLSERKREIVTYQEAILKEWKDLQTKITEYEENQTKLSDIMIASNKLENDNVELIIEIESNSNNIKIIKEDIENNRLHLDRINKEIDGIKEVENQIQLKIHKLRYERVPGYYTALERNLVNNGKCGICNNQNSDISSIAKQRLDLNLCQVCGMPLSSHNENITEEQKKLYEKHVLISNEIGKKINYKKKLEELINISIGEMNKLYNYNNSLNLKLSHNQTELVFMKDLLNKYNLTDKRDELLEMNREYQKTIDDLDKKYKAKYEERDRYKGQLANLYKQFSIEMKLISKDLSKYFNKYANIYLGMECKLTSTTKLKRGVPHLLFTPVIEGINRDSTDSVSESQRFFLDQAFRMAIIDYLRSKDSEITSSFITETPEGTLDIAYEIQVAKMFKLFCKNGNNVIFTSNINSSYFFKYVFEDLAQTERLKRILNMMEYGKTTNVQESNRELLDERLGEMIGR